MVAALAVHGEAHIDRYHTLTQDKAYINGHYYSEKAPLPALIMVPVWWAFHTTGLSSTPADGGLPDLLLAVCGILMGSLPFTLIICWTRRKLLRTGIPYASSIAVAAFFGSFLFAYSGSFFGHLVAAYLMLLAWEQRQVGRDLPAACLSAAAVLAEYSLFVFPLVWLSQSTFTGEWRRVFHLVMGGSPALLFMLYWNMVITGSPFILPYEGVVNYGEAQRPLGLAAPSVTALLALLFSTYRGLFIHAPVTALCMLIICSRLPDHRIKDLLLHPLLLPVILLVLLISAHSMWWGGWAWGPRHLTTVAVLILAFGLPKIHPHGAMGIAFLVLAGVGLFIGLAAKSTIGLGAPSDVLHPITELVLPKILAQDFTVLQWPVVLGLSPAIATFAFVFIFICTSILLYRMDRPLANTTT